MRRDAKRHLRRILKNTLVKYKKRHVVGERMRPTKILALVLAGGEGSRLYPLTAEHAKPALPFAGGYRIVDFVLSNLFNSGISSIRILTSSSGTDPTWSAYSPRTMFTAWMCAKWFTFTRSAMRMSA